MDEYNEITLTNDNPITNDVLKTETVIELHSVEEITDSEADSRTQGKAKATSSTQAATTAATISTKTLSLVSVLTVATAATVTIAVAAAISAPAAALSGINVTSYTDSGNICIEFVLDDSEDELETYSAWIEDIHGTVTICTLENSGEYFTAEAVLTETTDAASGLYFVFYAVAANGWEGEIYREAITLPYAPDVTVSNVDVQYEYNEDGGEVYIDFAFGGDTESIAQYTLYLEDEAGATYECTAEEYDGGIYAVAVFTADSMPEFDIYGRLSFVIDIVTTDGWHGEIYRGKYLIYPSTQANITYFGYNSVVTTQITLPDGSDTSGYSVWIEDIYGTVNACTTELADDVITATVILSDTTDIDNGLYLVVYANDDNCEIYREYLDLPAAPDLTIENVAADGYYTEGEDSDFYITFDYYGDTTNIAAYTFRLEDEDGNIYECVQDYETRAVITFTPEDTPAFDVYGRLYFVVSAVTADGWEGEICREKTKIATDGYVTEPWLSDIYLSCALDGDIEYVYLEITVYDPDVIWTEVTYILTDADGNTYTQTIAIIDDVGFEMTEDSYTVFYMSTLEIEGGLAASEDGTVNIQITVLWCEPDGNGGYNDYTTIIYDDAVEFGSG